MVVALVERAAVHANIVYTDGSILGQKRYRTVERFGKGSHFEQTAVSLLDWT